MIFLMKIIETDLLDSKRVLIIKKEEIVNKLLLFFQTAQHIHRGQAMPKDLGKNWQRLLSMKHVLLNRKRSIHSHNPIKGLMLDDYTKDSEYYAFLNVLCKFLFDDSDQAPKSVWKNLKKLLILKMKIMLGAY